MATRQPQGQDDFAGEPRSVDLRDYGLVLRRRRAIILVMILLGAALGYGYGQYSGHSYAATAGVIVAPLSQGPLNPVTQPNLQVPMSTEQEVAQSAPVAVLAARLLHSTVSDAQANAELSKHLSVAVPQLSDLLQLTWRASTPQAAQQGANAAAAAYLEFRHRELLGQVTRLNTSLTKQVANLQRLIKVASAQQSAAPTGSGQRQTLGSKLGQLNTELKAAAGMLASLPSYDASGGTEIQAARPLSPAGLGNVVIIVLGALLGLLAGVVIAFVRDGLDDRVRDQAVLERKLGTATLAVLPGVRSRRGGTAAGDGGQAQRGHAVMTVTRPGSRTADAIRSLRATLVAMGAGRNLRVIVVVGADGSVSSSHIVAELGVALAESGRRTLLVATDIRNSALPRIFDLPNTTGLTNLLAGDADDVLTQHPKYVSGVALSAAVAQRLALISNGPRLMQPLSVLDSKMMVGLLRSRRESYDFVVLDCPPADNAADFAVLASLVDGVVVVAFEGRSKGRILLDVRNRLDRVGAHIIGGVLVVRSRALAGVRNRPDPSDANIINGAFPASRPDHPAPARAHGSKPARRPGSAAAPDRRDVAPSDRRDVPPERRDVAPPERRDVAPPERRDLMPSDRRDLAPREPRRLASPPS